MDDESLLMNRLLKYPPKVMANLEIENRPGTTYHISPVNTIKDFSPRRIKRTIKGEDVLVERVCTARTILDCIRGYAVTIVDFFSNEANCAGNDSYRGGYYIYAIPYNVAVYPNPKLAPISEWCDELWLVDYKPTGNDYPAQIVGKFFYSEVISLERGAAGANLKAGRTESFATTTGEKNFVPVEVTMLVEIQEGMVPLNKHIILGKGYHRVTISHLDTYDKNPNSKANPNVKSVPITRTEYLNAKKSKADLLSYRSSPLSKW